MIEEHENDETRPGLVSMYARIYGKETFENDFEGLKIHLQASFYMEEIYIKNKKTLPLYWEELEDLAKEVWGKLPAKKPPPLDTDWIW